MKDQSKPQKNWSRLHKDWLKPVYNWATLWTESRLFYRSSSSSLPRNNYHTNELSTHNIKRLIASRILNFDNRAVQSWTYFATYLVTYWYWLGNGNK
jgi:hypothetical protein